MAERAAGLPAARHLRIVRPAHPNDGAAVGRADLWLLVTPTLLLTLYLTFGRGAWLALAAGLVATVMLDRRRAQAVTVTVRKPTPISGVLRHAGVRIRRSRAELG